MHLKDITSPEMLRNCSQQDLQELSGEMRNRIIQTVSRNGGHLASNLGMVELTIALHRAFDFPRDKIVFDVGHQCYAHKLLTGRDDSFDTLRQFGGMSGFPRRDESEYDHFDTGHASTAISAAVGMARARDLQQEDHHVVAVLGDGALTGGMCYEALNDAGSHKTRLIVVLNDNGMSISRNVGALSKHLTHLRAGKRWFGTKRAVSNLIKEVPLVGPVLHEGIQRIKNSLRSIFISDQFFDALGFHYLGPVDGFDVQGLERLMKRAKELDEPVLIHAVTQKGHGYEQAENDPTRLHGTPPFDVETGEPLSSTINGMSRVAGDMLCRLAQQDARVVAVTAAMTDSTGLGVFAKEYPSRLYDVGIAEEHAVTMAAGLAAGGARPFVAIYDTFLQRGYDQILHDVCGQKLPVCFLIDRAGLSEDGVTHHGIYGMAYLSQLPGMQVLCAASRQELRAMMRYALTCDGPVAIRYAKADVSGLQDDEGSTQVYTPVWQRVRKGSDAALLACGSMGAEAVKAAELLSKENIECAVYQCDCLQADKIVLAALRAQNMPVVTLEEGVLRGGFGSAVAMEMAKHGMANRLLTIGLEGLCTTQGAHEKQLQAVQLDAKHIAQRIKSWKDGWA